MSTGARSAAVGSDPGFRVTLASAAAAVAVATIPSQAVGLLGGRLTGAGSITGSQLALVTAAAGLGLTCFVIAAGDLSDRWGARRTITIGLVSVTAGAILAAAFTFAALLVGMFLAGAGQGVVGVASVAIVAKTVPQSQRARGYAVFGALAVGFAGVVALLVGALAGWSSPVWSMLITLPLAVGAAAAVRATVTAPQVPAGGAAEADRTGAFLAILATGVLFVAVSAMARRPSLIAVAGLLGGVAVLVAFVLWERRHANPVLDVSLLSRSPFIAVVAVASLATFGTGAEFTLATQFTGFVVHASGLGVALFVTAIALVGAASSLASAPLLRRLGARTLMATSLSLAAAMCMADDAVAGTDWPALALVGFAVQTFALGTIITPLRVLVADSVPPDRAGRAFGAFGIVRRFFGVLGTVLVLQLFVAQFTGQAAEELHRQGLHDVSAPTSVGSAERARAEFTPSAAFPGRAQLAAAGDRAFVETQRKALAVTAGSLVLAAMVSLALPRRRPPTTDS